MKAFGKMLTGAAGLAAIAGMATPASAQYYPGGSYGGYGSGYGQSGGGLGQILGAILGYGQYPYGNYGYNNGYRSSQQAIDVCARATEARINGYSSGYGQYGSYGGYNNGYGNPYGGYNNGYQNGYNPYGYNGQSAYGVNGQGRVLGITKVEGRSGGKLKVYGVASSGRTYSQPWGYGSYNYNSQYGTPDLRFNCKIDSYGRVTDVDIDRVNQGYRY